MDVEVASQHDFCPEGANVVETGVEMFQDTDVMTGCRPTAVLYYARLDIW